MAKEDPLPTSPEISPCAPDVPTTPQLRPCTPDTPTVPGRPCPREAVGANVEPDGLAGRAPQPPPRAPVPAAKPAAKPGQFARYSLLKELGRGGMGVVYKAFDPQLKRTVALKLLLGEGAGSDPELVRRFMREAQSAAKLRHPNIVEIYDVGVHAGRHFFTMSYHEGADLSKLLAGKAEGHPLNGKALVTRKRIEILHRIAEALDHAHRQGIVHRDLKPSNIVIAANGKPVITDFGLAKNVKTTGESRLTLTGTVVGTPAYMSPEQARGGSAKLGPPSDIYSLGTMMYELLTGRLPFESDDLMELLKSIAETDPRPPSGISQKVHHDLETVCLKAMAKEPGSRYVTMGEFAADIGRYLSGEPIHARPTTTAARLWRKAMKRRAVVVPSAIAVMLAVCLLVWLVLGAHLKSEKIRKEVEEAADFEKQGDFQKARDSYAGVLRLDERNEGASAGFARMKAKVDENAAAREQAALTAEAERERAQADAAAAQKALEKADRVQAVFERWNALAEPLARMEEAFYDSTLGFDEKRKRGDADWPAVDAFMKDTPSDPTSQSVMFALAGWARRLAGREDEGLEWMRKAAQLDADLPYGPLLQALVQFAAYLARQQLPTIYAGETGLIFGPAPPETAEMATIRKSIEELLEEASKARVWGKGIAEDFRTAIGGLLDMQAKRYEEAEKAMTSVIGTSAMRVFRTDIHFVRARLRYLCMRFKAGLEDLSAAISRRPMQAELYVCSGQLKWSEAEEMARRGEDARPLLTEAIGEFGKALTRSPEDPALYTNRGLAYASLGKAEGDRGEDPRATYEKAISDYSAALTQDPEFTEAYNHRGLVFLSLGAAEAARGGDRRAAYENAMRDFDEALRRNPEDELAYNNRGSAFGGLGEAEADRGVDPRATYRKAICDYDESLERNPEVVHTYNNRGLAWFRLGEAEAARGEDPRATYQKAVADFDEALKRSPAYARVYNNRGTALVALGKAEAHRGDDPRATYLRAVRDFDDALSRNPANSLAYNNRGTAWLKLGEAEAARGEDPRPTYRKAVDDFDEALKRNPESALAYSNRGIAYLRLGEAENARKEDPRETYRKAVDDFGEALKRNPELAEVYNNRGITWLGLGEAEAARGEDPRATCKKAIDDCSEALKRNPDYAAAYNSRGSAYRRLGEAEAARGTDPNASYEKALADYETALQKNPSNWMPNANRGLLFERLGRYAEAVVAYEAALRLCPGQPQVDRALKRAKEKAGK